MCFLYKALVNVVFYENVVVCLKAGSVMFHLSVCVCPLFNSCYVCVIRALRLFTDHIWEIRLGMAERVFADLSNQRGDSFCA